MNAPPIVIQAEFRREFLVYVTFNDGVAGAIDFRPWLEGPVFESLKDIHYFQRCFIDGGTITWPNGADIAPETLYEQAKKQRVA